MPAGDSLTKVVNIDDRRVVRALRKMEDALGGREALSDTLSDLSDVDSQDPSVQKATALASMLADPAHSSKSLATLCAEVGLSVGKFLKLFHDAKAARSFSITLSRFHDDLPRMADDIMKKAVTRKVKCRICKGIGRQHDAEGKLTKLACSKCFGTGVVVEESDYQRQKLAAEITGLVQNGSGTRVQVNTQVNVNEATGARTSASFREATDRLLYPGKSRKPQQLSAPIEAEIVNEKEGA